MHKIAPIVILTLALFWSTNSVPKKQTKVDYVTLLTYNIHHGVNLNDSYNLDKIGETIARSNVDIVGLQEVDQAWGDRSYQQKQLDLLAVKLRMYSAFAPALTNSSGGQYGIGILSKYPITSIEYYLLPGELEQRVLLVAGVMVNNQIMYIFDTHLGLSISDRTKQVAEILKVAEKYRKQKIFLMGDFNAKPSSKEIAPLMKYFNERSANLSTEVNETLIGRKVVIDSIFVSKNMNFKDSATLLSSASDHYPVYAKVKLELHKFGRVNQALQSNSLFKIKNFLNKKTHQAKR